MADAIATVSPDVKITQICIGQQGLYGLDAQGNVWKYEASYWVKLNMTTDKPA